jgi:hypothetical protein
MEGEGVLRAERLAGPPVATEPIALDGPVVVGGQRDTVVLVRLPDGPLHVGAEEVHGDAEVAGRKVRQAVRRHLVGDVEDLLQVLDRQVAAGLGLVEELDRRPFGSEHRCREVVRLDALAEVVGEIVGVGVTEGEVTERLQDHRARCPRGEFVPLAYVDDALTLVGDRSRRVRQVLHPCQPESEVTAEIDERALRDRPGPVIAHRRETVCGQALDVGEVVVASAHLVAQRDIGHTGQIARTLLALVPGLERLCQGDEVLEDLVGYAARRLDEGQVHRSVPAARLGALERHLELSPP